MKSETRMPAAVSSRTIEAMSPVCRGLPRYSVNGAVCWPKVVTLATTFPDPILLFAGHGFGEFDHVSNSRERVLP